MFTKEFISLCQSYAKKRSNILCEDIEDTKKICIYNIEFYNYVLQFRYIKKPSTFVKASSLYCTLKLRKNSIVHFHLTDIIPFLEHKTFNSCYFWNIETPERLKNCFESLESTVENVIAQIGFLTENHNVLLSSLFQNYTIAFNLKPNQIDFEKIDEPKDFAHRYFLSLQDIRDQFIFSRYSKFKPYVLLLQNKFDKALAKYEKLNEKNKLFEYEKLLISHIRDSEIREFRAFTPSCDTTAADTLFTPLSCAKAFLMCFVISAICFCGFERLYTLIVSKDALAFLSAPWYCILACAALCSIFGAIVFSMYMPNKHLNKEERRNFSNILISKGEKIFGFAAFGASVTASIVFALMMTLSNVRFYNDNIKFPDGSYNYSQIDSVYHIDARHNPYGDRIERESYVILFDDKETLDLDGYTSVEYTETEVLPLLQSKGFNVKFVDSDKDIPQ